MLNQTLKQHTEDFEIKKGNNSLLKHNNGTRHLCNYSKLVIMTKNIKGGFVALDRNGVRKKHVDCGYAILNYLMCL